MSVEPTDHLLGRQESERIFREQIVPQQFAGGTAKQHPTLAIVAGQPGAGKSRTEASVRADLGLDDAVGIDADDLRIYHPRYEQLAAADDRSVASHTHRDAQRWVAMAREHAIAHRYDVVLSATMGNPVSAAATLEQFQKAGYQIQVAVVAVHEAQSRLGVLARYQQGHEEDGYGRHVPAEVQAEAYTGLLDTIDRIEDERLADVLRIYQRDGQGVYRNDLDADGQWTRKPQARQTIEAARVRPWSPEQVTAYQQQAASLRESLPAQLQNELTAALQSAQPYLTATMSPQPNPQPQPTDGRTEPTPPADPVDWRSRPYGSVPTARLPGELAAAEREAARLREVAERRAGQADQTRSAVQTGQAPAMRELEQRRAQLTARIAAGRQAADARAAAEAGYATSRQAWQQVQHLDAEQQRNPLEVRQTGTSRAQIAAQQQHLREIAHAAAAEANHHDSQAQELDRAAGGPDGAAAATAELDDLTTHWEHHAANAQQRDADASRSHDDRAAAARDQVTAAEQRSAELRAEAQLRDRADPDTVRLEEAARQAWAEHIAEADREGPTLEL